jgi:hypothetical protein
MMHVTFRHASGSIPSSERAAFARGDEIDAMKT